MKRIAILAVFTILFGPSFCLAADSTTTVPSPTPVTGGSSTSASAIAPEPVELRLGVEVQAAQDFSVLKGKQVGLITNQTGVDSMGRSTADLLSKAPGVKLVALFSPEHGIRGKLEGGEKVGDTVDAKTHVPVYSLYGAVQKPTQEMLNGIDVLVFDMQDVGTRFYTYLTTMGLAMEAAANRKIGFVVFDRPNPLGGEVLEGQVLDSHVRHFTAYYSVPVRHGFTAGELAQWYAKTGTVKVKLQVIPMTGWKRETLWDDTGLDFIAPSPNIRTPTAALLYSGVGIFEATNVAVGRGTDSPFERIGAPWMNGVAMAHRLNQVKLPGLKFVQTRFTPTADIYAGQACAGVRILVTDARLARPVDMFVHMAMLLRELSPADFQPRWDEMIRVTGSRDFEKMYKDNRTAAEIISRFQKSAEDFKQDRKPFLLY